MLILGISASPRKNQTTRRMLDEALRSAEAVESVRTEVIDLAKAKFSGCIGCGKCVTELTCSQKDAFLDWLPLLTDPELAAIICATPVYFGGPSSQAKAFWDRCVPLRRNGFLLKDKVGGCISVGGSRHGGQELSLMTLHAAMFIQGMILVGDEPPTAHFGGMAWSGMEGGLEADEYGLSTAANLGKRVAKVASRLAG